ncbi:hypothetical protein J4228_00835 [Candidatus Woesearchaeota archaeon]|nr:hypothetical protein [Candidatus Woesearchaeota archaeon]
MVKEAKERKGTFYLCPQCNMKYAEKSTAEKCEAWCKKYHSCNINIIKYAVKE